MNVQFYSEGRKSTKKIYVRLYQNKLDISVATDLIVLGTDWDDKNEQSFSDNNLNEILANLKLQILRNYNASLSSGKIISTQWLREVVKTTFDRPLHEKDLVNDNYTLYFSDFAFWWMENHAPKWKTSARKLMSKTLISQYKKFLEDFKIYEGTLNSKVLLKDFTQEAIYDYVDYLIGEKYAISTIKRGFIERVRFFLNRASSLDFQVSKNYSETIFFDSEEEIDGVYLNPEEIKAIFELDLSHDEVLDNVRDNLIISCWTSLRISDFMANLNTDNIKDNIISIKTQKTGAFVKLPLHPQIKSILNKRFGQLPNKISFSEYNRLIKIVAQLANIDNVVYGKLFNSETQRKELGYRPKYKYVSSHIGRRSLITNLRGKISDNALASIGGWSTTKLLDTYNQTTKLEYAQQLEKLWEQ